MTHATPPPKAPIVAPAPTPTPALADVEIISNAIAYHIPVSGVPCAPNTLFVSRIVRRPSQRMTVVVSCDGPAATTEINDDAPAPVAARKTH